MAEPEVQLTALKSWASIAAHGLADVLRPEITQSIEIGSTEVDVLAHDVLSAALPEEGLGTFCNVKDGTVDLPIAVIFEKDAALAVIASRRDELAALPARRTDKRALDEDERLALAVVGTVIADGFQALAQKLFPNATVTTMGAGVIAEGNWGDATPAFTMDVGRVELVLRWGDGDSAAARILVAGPLLEKTTAAPAAPKAEKVKVDPRAARSGAVLALTDDAALVEKIKTAVAPVGVTPIGDVTDFLRQWKSGAALGAVACVRAGDEGTLPLLGGMHRLPGVNDRPFFVVLEKPTIEAVVLCGRAEIYDVLPADFTADDLKGRWPARKA